MAVFRIQLTDGDKRVKTDLKAPDEGLARVNAEKCFDGSRWRIVEIRRLSD